MSSFEEDLAKAQGETEKRSTPWVPWKRWEYGQQKVEAKIIDLLQNVDHAGASYKEASELRKLHKQWNDLGHKIREAGGKSPHRIDMKELMERANE